MSATLTENKKPSIVRYKPERSPFFVCVHFTLHTKLSYVGIDSRTLPCRTTTTKQKPKTKYERFNVIRKQNRYFRFTFVIFIPFVVSFEWIFIIRRSVMHRMKRRRKVRRFVFAHTCATLCTNRNNLLVSIEDENAQRQMHAHTAYTHRMRRTHTTFSIQLC